MFESVINYYKEVFSNPNPLFIIGQVLGILLLIERFFITIQKERKNIIKLKLVADVVHVPQLFFLGGITGAILNIFAIPREIVFYFRGKKKWASHLYWLFVFGGCIIASQIFTWEGVVGLFATVGSLFSVVGYYCSKPYMMRIFIMIGSTLWLVYAFFIASIGGIIGGIIDLISGCIGLIRDYIRYKKNKKLGLDNQN